MLGESRGSGYVYSLRNKRGVVIGQAQGWEGRSVQDLPHLCHAQRIRVDCK